MANEFIIKNGFHSKGDSQITGSLTGTSGTLNEFSSSYALTASHALSAPTSPGGNNQEVQFNNSGVLAGNSNFKINNSTGIVSMINGAYFNSSNSGIIKYTPATEVLGINADDDSAHVEITGYDGGTKIRIGDDSANDGIQITSSLGGVNIKGSIEGTDQFTLPKFNVSASILSFTNNNYKINATNATSIIFNNDDRSVVTRIKGSDGLGSELQVGNKETLISGSLHVKQFGIASSAGLLLNDSANGNTARANSINIIQAPSTSPGSGAPGAPVIIKGGNSDGSGAKGGDLYLEGGIPSAGIGGNIYIAGGNGSTSGSVHLKGNKINLDNTALEYYNNASNFYKLLNYNSSDQCAEIGIISYTATGGNARDVKFFADGEEAFKITGGSSQKATLLGSRSGQHTEVRATSGSFSYLRGASPLVIDADNFKVNSTGEMSSGTGDGISTTNITASSDISSSGTITGNSFVGSGANLTGNARITGSLNVSGSVDIEIPSGSAFTIHEGDASTNYENRLDFYYTQHDPTLEIAARSATSTLLLSKDGGASYSTTLTVLGQLTYKSAGVNYGVQLGTAFKPVTTNQQDLGFYNRRWKNAYLYSGNKLGWGTTNANEHAAFSHTVGTGKVTLESDAYTPSFDIDGPITASAFKGDGSALTNLPASSPFPFTGSANISGSSEIIGSGSAIFQVEGSVGTLFSIDDGLDDVIFAANNISGTPVIEANADNTVKLGKLGGFGIVISGSTPAPSDTSANIIITGSIQHNGSYGLGVAASATIGRFDASNDVVAFSTSDERLKKYVKNIPNALDKVSQINGVTFQWKKTDDEIKQNVHSFEGKDVGVIAQEIEKVLPEVVITRDNGYKAVKYEKIIPLLIESVKELKAEIEELKKSNTPPFAFEKILDDPKVPIGTVPTVEPAEVPDPI